MPPANNNASEISILAQENPSAARKKIIAAYQAARAHLGDAARTLGVSHKTLSRIVERLGIGSYLASVEKLAKEQGWHHGRNKLSPGAPPGQRKKRRKTKAA